MLLMIKQIKYYIFQKMNLYKVINNVKIFINDIENTFINISKNNKYNVNYIKKLGNDLLEYLIIYSYSKKEN